MASLTSAEAYSLTDNKAEAQVLRSLSFWETKAKTVKNGFVWMIKTAKEIIENLGMYSESTIKRALRRLKAKGLIVIHHSYHPYQKAKFHVSWIRLAPHITRIEKNKVVEQDQTPEVVSQDIAEGGKTLPSKEAECPLQTGQNDPFLYRQENCRSISGDHIEAGKPVQATKPTPSEKIAKRRSTFSKTPNPILEKMRNDRRRERKKTRLNATDVFFDFMSQSRENFPEHVPDPKSAVTLKFAKTFLAKCRQHNQSDDDVLQLIANAVVTWDEFKSWKKSKAGSGIKAEYANLKDLMRFAEQLIAYSNEEMAPEPEEDGHTDDDGIFIPEGWGQQ